MEKQKEEQLAQRRADNIFSVNSFDLKIPKDYEKIIKIVFGGRTSAIAVQLSGKRGCALYRWIRAASGDNIAKFKFSTILNIFVDPSGHHILVSAENKVYYVHSSFSEGKEFHLRNFPQDTRYCKIIFHACKITMPLFPDSVHRSTQPHSRGLEHTLRHRKHNKVHPSWLSRRAYPGNNARIPY